MVLRRSFARAVIVVCIAAILTPGLPAEAVVLAVLPETTIDVIEDLGHVEVQREEIDGERTQAELNDPDADEPLRAPSGQQDLDALEESEEPPSDELEDGSVPGGVDGAQTDSQGGGNDAAQEAAEGVRVLVLEPFQTDEPFSMLGLRAAVDGVVSLRVSEDGQTWDDWTEAEFLGDEDGPEQGELADAPDPSRFTDPIWVGEANYLQLRLEGISPESVEVHLIDSMGLSRNLPERIADVGRALLRTPAGVPAGASTSPSVVTRSEWGANESYRKNPPSYASELQFAVLHHTATSNTYTAAQAPGVVRGIHAYHAVTLGWNDIGYNALVDRFGTVYEGRFGGLDKVVIGAHARNFNSGSFGIALIGNHEVAPPSTIAVDRMVQMTAWKFSVHGLDPTKQPVRSGVNHALVGHRDVGSTACPGRFVIAQMDSIRSAIASRVAAPISTMGLPRPPAGAAALLGDWDGDGVATPGWFAGGQWALAGRDGSVRVLTYGRAGDVPVTGDFNGDGVDTIGVVRTDPDGRLRFILRYVYRSGADITMLYGVRGDTPVIGDWNGDGIDTLGVVRTDPDGRLRFILRYAYRSGADITMHYGVRGDTPVVGDFNGDGTDTLGVRREARFILRYEYRSGSDIVLDYGWPSDTPVIGDFNGDGTDTLGVRRGPDWLLRYVYRSGADIRYRW